MLLVLRIYSRLSLSIGDICSRIKNLSVLLSVSYFKIVQARKESMYINIFQEKDVEYSYNNCGISYNNFGRCAKILKNEDSR